MNQPPLSFLKAVPPCALPDIAAASSSPYAHCSFQILQTTRTFLSDVGFVNVSSDAAEAAQGRALSDWGQCWHTSAHSPPATHAAPGLTGRKLLAHPPAGNMSRKGASRETALNVALCIFLTLQKAINSFIHSLDAFQSYK